MATTRKKAEGLTPAEIREQKRKQAAAKAARYNARRREFPGAVIWTESDADPSEWTDRVLMSDLPHDIRSRTERKLKAMGFEPAAEWGVDGLAVSGDNEASVWLMPRDVYEAEHGQRRRDRAAQKFREAGVAARPAGPAFKR